MPDRTPHDSSSSLHEEALAWLVRLHSGHASESDRRAFQAWRTHSIAHRLAAQEAETLWRNLGELGSGHRSLDVPAAPVPRRSRQAGIRRAIWAIAACFLLVIGWFAPEQLVGWVTIALADHHTGVGRQQVVTLQDGSRIHLNRDSAVNVTYTDRERTVRLLKGEAAFTVSPDVLRPFLVQSGNLRSRALGTAFVVRLHQDAVTVTVTEHAVHLSPASGNDSSPLVLHEGEQASYTTKTGLSPAHPVDSRLVASWQRGKLIVETAPLAEVVDELNRYRSGHIMIVNPALRPLTVTGLFDITDPDAALRMIEDTLRLHHTALTSYLILLH